MCQACAKFDFRRSVAGRKKPARRFSQNYFVQPEFISLPGSLSIALGLVNKGQRKSLLTVGAKKTGA
jgi:hypothetical protein